MGLGRRKIRLEHTASWVFNRMADVYEARPAYPGELVAALSDLAAVPRRIVDIGAGIGHLALPLAQHGCAVTAIEPAELMLARLCTRALAAGLQVRALHATAEALPLDSGSLDLALVADALHFLDAERAGREIGRVLAPGAALAVVTCELGDTPFMNALVRVMEEAAPRRPRPLALNLTQLAAVAEVSLEDPRTFYDETPVDHAALERILRSISFIGPAMNAQRFAAFWQRVEVLSATPVWARRFTLRSGRRR